MCSVIAAAPQPPAPRYETLTIPQADDLDTVRQVLEMVVAGHVTRPAIREATGFTERHMQYRVRAALLLGLLTDIDEALSITPAGRAILAAPARSDEERALWREAFVTVPALAEVAGDLFAAHPPKRAHLAARISAATLMAQSTAVRRATTLLAWRRRILPRQLSLFEGWGAELSPD